MPQTILGIDPAAIAYAFRVPPTAMRQRLARAKSKIRFAGVPFKVPDSEDPPEQLVAVRDAIHAAFRRGWTSGAASCDAFLTFPAPEPRIAHHETILTDFEDRPVWDGGRNVTISRFGEALAHLRQFPQAPLVEVEPGGGKADALADLRRGAFQLEKVGRRREAEVEVEQVRQTRYGAAVQSPALRLSQDVEVDWLVPHEASHGPSYRPPRFVGFDTISHARRPGGVGEGRSAGQSPAIPA